MALYEHLSYEETDEEGQTWLKIGDELVEVRCARCNGEAFPQVCPGDGRYHHHGCVHTAIGGFEAVCNDCVTEVAKEWSDRSELTRSVRELIDSL